MSPIRSSGSLISVNSTTKNPTFSREPSPIIPKEASVLTTSKTRPIVSLCIETDSDFSKNLDHLLALIDTAPEDAIIVSPEVCLSGFAYERFEEAAAFTATALESLARRVGNRLLIFTAITKEDNLFYNIAYALHENKILYRQPKAKLFTLGNEHEYFHAGEEKQIAPFL